ncbi:MAG: hypothetical protein VSS75_029630 [Candidatus Parabeggiatoa sp.]|nr:hypothetical protein [Candidatus Parabeggiatoa sp.]
MMSLSTEPQINRYFTAKRREASRLYETANCRDARPCVSTASCLILINKKGKLIICGKRNG